LQATHEDILAVARLVRELCGLALDESKGYLIESRLGAIAKAAGCASFAELAARARFPGSHALQNEIIDAITTQETLFFRDESPFEALRNKVLPELIDRKANTPYAKRLRLWSAACSTGQELYSLAMTLSETLPDVASWDVNILGTDISNAAVRHASRGWYAKHEIQRGMKPNMLTRYFREESGGYHVKDELRGMATFNHRNLLEPFADLGPFDVIFCRNVAIYFDGPTRRDFFLRLSDRLSNDGCLFVGSSECLIDLGPRFAPQQYCRSTFYQPGKLPGPVTMPQFTPPKVAAAVSPLPAARPTPAASPQPVLAGAR
jgi:chemotaxis protein methyltransferase CheR